MMNGPPNSKPIPDTARLKAADCAHVLHPWQLFDIFPEEGALPIAAGDGAYLFDSDGKRYLDAVGGLWCTNIGLGREEMADAIAAQVRTLAYASPFVDMTNVPAVQLADKLAQLAPGELNHVMFCCSGSAAVDSAFRLVQYYQNCRGKRDKKYIISRHNAYHGSTYAAMSIGGKPGDHPPEFDYISDRIYHISAPNFYRAGAGLSEAEFLAELLGELEQTILDIGPDKVAAFFAEPVMGAGGVIVPPAGYHRGTREICRQYDVLYVSDEVVTAFGRLGHWFASQDVFGIQPDIITVAKGITSGYIPLGATLYSEQIHRVISEPGKGRCFAHGFTYSGHPVACAAALKNIDIMEREHILEHVREMAPYLQAQLQTLRDLPIVGDVRGMGMMACVEFVRDKVSRARFAEELDVGKWVSNEADRRGLIVRPIINLNVMSPPLIITRDQVDFIVSTLRESIQAATAQLIAEGHF
ncbi:aminotransferase [Porticoccus sp.]